MSIEAVRAAESAPDNDPDTLARLFDTALTGIIASPQSEGPACPADAVAHLMNIVRPQQTTRLPDNFNLQP